MRLLNTLEIYVSTYKKCTVKKIKYKLFALK
jgi:hypothetical protein